MRETTSLCNHIYSAESTMKYFLRLKSECIFVPISVELVLDWEHILVALLHITYKAVLSALIPKELGRTRK